MAGAAVTALLFAACEQWAEGGARESLVNLARARLPLVTMGLRARVDALAGPV